VFIRGQFLKKAIHMNTGPLKSYAIQARKDFIQAVTDRAAQLGITEISIAPVQAQRAQTAVASAADTGVVVIAGTPFPASVVHARELVVAAIERDGFRAVIEQVAYTWFNRLVALRYMEIHGYLDHGLRVLSDPNGGAVPEAVARLRDLDLPTLNKPKAVELAMAGNQDEALYRLILLAQCKHLATSMPWLFDTRLHEGVDLLLPDHLLATDSLVNELVTAIPEDDWKQGVEIIGWLYQFFISERKDEVIGSVVAPEDIPAATQLFTPNWIVQYLVQNSVGRLWMESYPNSTLRQHMPYYIEPAPQDPEVQAELDKLIVRDRTPESLTVLDPACGSGHILVEAFRLLFQIYLERGHREREIPRLIFANNLFGLDIDDRAAQLACMTLLFEARRYDARIFISSPTLRVLAIQQSRDSDRTFIEGSAFSARTEAKALINLFREAKTLGSLLRVTEPIRDFLPKIRAAFPTNLQQKDFLADQVTDVIRPLLTQSELMSRRYDVVLANPPYMGGKGMTKELKNFAKDEYPNSKSDAFAMFIERGFELANDHGFNAMVTMQSWMFLSSYEMMRESLLSGRTISCMSHMTNGVMGIAFGTAATVIRNKHLSDYNGSYCYTTIDDIGDDARPVSFPIKNGRLRNARQSDFAKIPGMPVAYWVSEHTREIFGRGESLSSVAKPRVGMRTGDNERFLRQWHEVSLADSNSTSTSASEASNSGQKWFPFVKGGDFRKWFGNIEQVVNWADNGHEIKKATLAKYPQLSWDNLGWKISNEAYYFRSAITWTAVSSSCFGVRFVDAGSIFGTGGSCIFPDGSNVEMLGALLCSNVGHYFMGIGNPTLNINIEDVAAIPILPGLPESVIELARSCWASSRIDWNAYERSWDFQSLPLLKAASDPTLESSYTAWITQNKGTIAEMKRLEEENNRLFIDTYGLADELTPDVPIEQITLTVNPAYRYGGKLTDEELWTRFRQDTMQELISYAIGCMMGRYSLDAPGLIYAHSGNEGFDPSRYASFLADDDGIIPLTDDAWFDDDITERFAEFLSKAWPGNSNKPRINTDTHGSENESIRVHPCSSVDNKKLDENMKFVADVLGAKTNESPKDSIRRYLANDFYKYHCQTYKKRPIYWLFSSGKNQAFECLVYLHRYNADTLGRMRADYVIPLQGKLQGRLTALTEDVASAGSTAQRKQTQKALDLIAKKIRELATFDDQLRTYADKRIELDLDDGVKVNIRKFGTLIDLGPLGGADE